MKQFTELIVRIADLAEAEGRLLRESLRHEGHHVRQYVERLGVGFVMLVGSAVLVITGAGFLVAGLYLALRESIGQAAGAAATGLIAVIVGVGVVWMFRRTVRN